MGVRGEFAAIRVAFLPALAGRPFVGNHCVGGTRSVVNHRPRMQPRHHSILPEKRGVVSQGRSAS